MYPTFDIYLSILYGTWQPWLASNRNNRQFDRLLQSIKPDNESTCSDFFKRLASMMKRPRLPHEKEFLKEALRLAYITGCPGSNGFLYLPTVTTSERFYTLLIGYSLQGYEMWITRLLQEHKEKESGNWYHSRLTDRLHTLLRVHELPKNITTGELLIFCSVKTALCILLHRLTIGRKIKYNGYHGEFTPHGELKWELAAANLPPPHVENIMLLFDAATGTGKPVTTTSAPDAPATASLPNNGSNMLSNDTELAKIIKELKKDWEISNQLLNTVIEKNPLQKKPSAESTCQLVDGKTVREMLHISKSSLQRLCKKELPPHFKIGSKFLYKKEDVLQLIEEGKRQVKNRVPGKSPPNDNN